MIGANLRGARKAAGLAQEEVAWRAQVHRTQVSLWENGAQVPRLLSLVKLAGACSVTPNDLLAGLEWEPAEYSYGRLVVGEEGDR
jgi:transcriptional regulator with XRE-family HTH domain